MRVATSLQIEVCKFTLKGCARVVLVLVVSRRPTSLHIEVCKLPLKGCVRV